MSGNMKRQTTQSNGNTKWIMHNRIVMNKYDQNRSLVKLQTPPPQLPICFTSAITNQ